MKFCKICARVPRQMPQNLYRSRVRPLDMHCIQLLITMLLDKPIKLVKVLSPELHYMSSGLNVKMIATISLNLQGLAQDYK